MDTEAIHMQGSYWGEALAKWKELNCTAHFSAFYGDVADKSRSLTQLLHHKHDIFDILVSHLKIKDSLALEPILK